MFKLEKSGAESVVENSAAEKGFYGEFGGSFVPEDLKSVLGILDENFEKYKDDPEFKEEFNYYMKEYIGRENPLTFAENLTKQVGGAKIYLKREDLNHTGAHKINNAIGQILLAKRMGATRIIAETGAGQHGVATATACAIVGGMKCIIYMGKHDTERQALNVFRMQLLGAEVVAVDKGQARLKDAVDAALSDLVENYENTFYLLGSAVGPHPFPSMVKHFQSIISEESKRQILEKEGKLPTAIVACAGGGSNAIGAFAHYIEEDVRLIGVEPEEAATLTKGVPAVIHGFKCLTLLDEKGEPQPTFSIAAGLDYPGVGPEHSHLKTTNRAEYVTVSGQEALEAFQTLSKVEGIIPALESSHAVAHAIKLASQLDKNDIIIVNLSGRGDKDVEQVYKMINK
ncbi:tryptophan synthase subunit beta [Peribacillus saganii]|uniref:Tryptophan synthase beta chain n=1 Tax=Peribacillus saganii TaxID=2303992 RepID=A0A372LEC9_9BACI|nr:tryptophan synthase subunit beta [Peribacillus saganii]